MIDDNDYESGDDDSKEWMNTFTDLSLLLLTFFILLFSMSQVNSKQFEESFGSVRDALGSTGKGGGGKLDKIGLKQDELGAILDEAMMRRQMEEGQKRVFSGLQFNFAQHGLEGKIGASLDKGTITLSVPAELLFPSSSADLSPQGRDTIVKMKDIFAKFPDQTINIKGFTDDQVPRPGGKYGDNWELSAMRAVNVLRILVESGLDPNKMTATGLADLQPLLPNTTDENRARNRRVEFVLEKRIGG